MLSRKVNRLIVLYAYKKLLITIHIDANKYENYLGKLIPVLQETISAWYKSAIIIWLNFKIINCNYEITYKGNKQDM